MNLRYANKHPTPETSFAVTGIVGCRWPTFRRLPTMALTRCGYPSGTGLSRNTKETPMSKALRITLIKPLPGHVRLASRSGLTCMVSELDLYFLYPPTNLARQAPNFRKMDRTIRVNVPQHQAGHQATPSVLLLESSVRFPRNMEAQNMPTLSPVSSS